MKRALPTFVVLCVLGVTTQCFACFPGPAAAALLTANRAIFHHYGLISLSFGTLASGMRLVRGNIVSLETVVLLVPLIYIVTCIVIGFQRQVDCGVSSAQGSVLNAQIAGALFVWQTLALSLYFFNSKPKGKTTR